MSSQRGFCKQLGVVTCWMCVHMQAHERLEEVKLQAVRNDNVQLVTEIVDALNNLPEKDAAVSELAKILQEPNFKVVSTSLPLV